MSSKFLDYEVALILAKYGRDAVLRALARKLDLTAEELTSALDTPPTAPPSRRSPKRPSLDPVMSRILAKHPEKGDSIETLRRRYDSRAFLPELRDVRRFFEQHGHQPPKARSRAKALPELLDLLAGIDPSELTALAQMERDGTYSSLGVIADEILRRER